MNFQKFYLADAFLHKKNHPHSPKSRYAMDKARKQNRINNINSTLDFLQNDSVKCLSYDGKKVGGQDKHVALLNIDGKDFLLGFCKAKAGRSIAAGIIDWLKTDKIKTETVLACMVDSASVNTGKHNGANRAIEEFIGHSVVWGCCSLHWLELTVVLGWIIQ